ncbi:hypothetical protein SRHO_G00007740 [Serrasalmus rhombeus]
MMISLLCCYDSQSSSSSTSDRSVEMDTRTYTQKEYGLTPSVTQSSALDLLLWHKWATGTSCSFTEGAASELQSAATQRCSAVKRRIVMNTDLHLSLLSLHPVPCFICSVESGGSC